jgi:FKBP-type peptidyl-prolyl cis-trans isomerase FkpA
MRTALISRRLSAAALVALLAMGCGEGSPSTPILPSAPFSQTDLTVGTGAEAVTGRRLFVNYTGWIYDPLQPQNKGRQFDTSAGRTPLSFVLNATPSQVITGFEQGLVGMRVGGTRRLIIPPNLGFGSTGSAGGTVPPNATLVFDVELIDVQ